MRPNRLSGAQSPSVMTAGVAPAFRNTESDSLVWYAAGRLHGAYASAFLWPPSLERPALSFGLHSRVLWRRPRGTRLDEGGDVGSTGPDDIGRPGKILITDASGDPTDCGGCWVGPTQ